MVSKVTTSTSPPSFPICHCRVVPQATSTILPVLGSGRPKKAHPINGEYNNAILDIATFLALLISGEYDNAILDIASFLALAISGKCDKAILDIATFLAFPISREYDNLILDIATLFALPIS